MANEKRLIDANALCISIFATKCCLVKGGSEWVNGYRDALQAVLELVNEETTVDAVEVVRCKDCKHYKTITCSCGCQCVSDNWYCADGERKDNG